MKSLKLKTIVLMAIFSLTIATTSLCKPGVQRCSSKLGHNTIPSSWQMDGE